jgi:hypothetical protein
MLKIKGRNGKIQAKRSYAANIGTATAPPLRRDPPNELANLPGNDSPAFSSLVGIAIRWSSRGFRPDPVGGTPSLLE